MLYHPQNHQKRRKDVKEEHLRITGEDQDTKKRTIRYNDKDILEKRT